MTSVGLEFETFDGTEKLYKAIGERGLRLRHQPTVIIAGASVGVGRALVEHFSGYQNHFVIGLDKLAVKPDWFEGSGSRTYGWNGFFVYNMDCSDPGKVRGVFERLFQEGLGRIQAPLNLIATLGLNRLRWFKDGPHSSFKDVLDANLLAPMYLASAFAKGMYDPNELAFQIPFRRTITFYSSIAGEIPMRTTAPYCSAKAGLNMLIRCLAREFAPAIEVYGITLGPIAPSEHGTQMDDVVEQIAEQRGKTIEEVWEETAQDIPVGNPIPLGEVMGLQAQIITGNKFSIYNSGTNFRLTGGRT